MLIEAGAGSGDALASARRKGREDIRGKVDRSPLPADQSRETGDFQSGCPRSSSSDEHSVWRLATAAALIEQE